MCSRYDILVDDLLIGRSEADHQDGRHRQRREIRPAPPGTTAKPEGARAVAMEDELTLRLEYGDR
jgi:hypothetical protein